MVRPHAFEYCTALTSVSLPGVSVLSECAFRGCTALEEALLSGMTTLENDTFANCTALAEVTLGATLTEIERFAFYGCSALTALHWQGTQAAWQQVTIGEFNAALERAEVTCDA